jgi:hypothetical protein
VQFERRLRLGIADGSITMTFRRWARPQVVTGHRYRTGDGMIEMDAVDIVDIGHITRDEAQRAGYGSVAELRRGLRGPSERPVYRLAFHSIDGPDPRAELAADDRLGPEEVAAIHRRLERLDRSSSHGPWTASVLELIASRPGVRAPDLAARMGRETPPFKRDVRKLKNLGLTFSLPVGYRLSPRGEACWRAHLSSNRQPAGSSQSRRRAPARPASPSA